MDELYMGTEERQTELETELDALRDEPVVQTETVSDAPSAEDSVDPEGIGTSPSQSGAQQRRERRVRPAPVVSIDDRLGVETDADKARDAICQPPRGQGDSNGAGDTEHIRSGDRA